MASSKDSVENSFANLSICNIDVSFSSREELILLNSGCKDWKEFYSRTPSTRQLSPEKRYEVIMKWTSVMQFMDPSRNGQHILDLDLFPEWEERRRIKEDLCIRLLEKPVSPALSYVSVVKAAKSASKHIFHLASDIYISVWNNKSYELRGPLQVIPCASSGAYRVPIPRAFYAMRFVLPKHSQCSDRYDPMAQFWMMHRYEVSQAIRSMNFTTNHYSITFAQRPFSGSTLELLQKFDFDPEFNRVFDYLLKDEFCYPDPTELQIEQLLVAKTLLSVAAHLLLAIVKGDLPMLFSILNAIIDIILSLRALLYLDYNLREKCI